MLYNIKLKYITIIVLFLFGCVYSTQNRIEQISVIRVVDGDSFWAKTENGQFKKIRLAYIDSPELGQPFGLTSFYILDSLIGDKKVNLYYLNDDKYGRKIGIVYMYNGVGSVNEWMVKRGMSWASSNPNYSPKVLYEEMLVAKKNKKGLWQNPYPEEPFKFRNRKKTIINKKEK